VWEGPQKSPDGKLLVACPKRCDFGTYPRETFLERRTRQTNTPKVATAWVDIRKLTLPEKLSKQYFIVSNGKTYLLGLEMLRRRTVRMDEEHSKKGWLFLRYHYWSVN
jgi:hypothetical protein